MRDLVVYAAGGGMRGIFGAGVLHGLAGMGLRDRAGALYGISSGAFNIAQFALGSTGRATEWYLREVPAHGLFARVPSVSILRGEDVINLPEAGRVLAAEKLIDADALSRSEVPVSFGVVNAETLDFRWLDARRPDAIQVLLASSTIFPFVRQPVLIDGMPYIDGGYREWVCATRLQREHPDAKVLIVLNDSEEGSRVWRVAVAAFLRVHNEGLAAIWRATMERSGEELAAALASPRVLVIKPDGDVPVHFSTTDAAILEPAFEQGLQTAQRHRDRLMRFLDA